jgi:hypothetical protein
MGLVEGIRYRNNFSNRYPLNQISISDIYYQHNVFCR